ncbi:SMI1/KNR4 family protein OS=Lysinibacillus sphaericus OX=1421 GN=LS41612_13375 PE=4 SV=1 [Lysinibacillus sphaericus]
MKQLEKSIFKFIEALNQYPKKTPPLKKTEESVIMPKLAKLDVDEKIYLSPELILFYQQCEIICNIRPDGYQLDCTDIDLGNSLLFLYAADKLVRRQEGFRWIGTEKKENPNWYPIGL